MNAVMDERVEAKTGRPNRLDDKMTAAQIARRKFKSSLPRKLQHRQLKPFAALGETFTLLDAFRGLSPRPNETVFCSLAFYRDSSLNLAETLTVPTPEHIAEFCDQVMKMTPEPKFLGLVFFHIDLDAKKAAQATVSFCVPFMVGPEWAARLHFAQQKVAENIARSVAARLVEGKVS